MEVKQIYQLVNSVTSEVLGRTDLVAEDLTNVVDVGTEIVNAAAVDNYVKSLVNHIGKVIFVNRPYSGKVPSVLMDGWEFGSVLEKVTAEIPAATENEGWELTNGEEYKQDIFYKPTVSAKFFNSRVTFEVPISITERQVKESFSSAAQGDVYIFPEPGGKRDVPPPPEVRDALGHIGVAEVLHEPEPQHPAQAAGHVGVAGEVEIDLKCIGDEAHPGPQYAGLPGGGRQLPPQDGHAVRQQHLFPQARHEQPHPPGEALQRQIGAVQLFLNVHVPDDGPRDELGEHGHVGPKEEGAFLGFGLAPVNVDHVGHDLKGEEGDADGQTDSYGLLRKRRGEQALHRVPNKAGILEDEQQEQIQDDGGHQPDLPVGPLARYPKADEPVYQDGTDHQKHVQGLSPGVEDQAGKQQKADP